MWKISVYKIFFVYLFVLGFWDSGITKVFASPPAPAPKCYVKGVIQSVRFEKAYELPCVKISSCPTDTQLSYPNRYYLSVNIQGVSFKDGDTRFQTCSSLYPLNSLQEIFIDEDKVIAIGGSFKKGHQIEGVVSSFWGYSFDSYQITSITPKPCTQDANPCNPISCSYDPEKCLSLPQTTPIGGPPQSIFEKIKLFFDGMLDTVFNFINGVKPAETKTKYNY